MKSRSQLIILEESIAHDQKFFFTLVSCVMVLVILINLNSFLSPAIGVAASIVYFVINGVFLGRAFFERETFFLRFALGNLLLVVFLGAVAWAVMISYNLDTIRSAIALSIVTILSSFLNRLRTKRRERGAR